MGYAAFARDDRASREMDLGDEVTEVARMASTVAAHVCSILDDGVSLEIEVEAGGWTERVFVASPTQPGAVRGAVEKVLRDLGLPRT